MWIAAVGLVVVVVGMGVAIFRFEGVRRPLAIVALAMAMAVLAAIFIVGEALGKLVSLTSRRAKPHALLPMRRTNYR